jgi:hypothetical protein
VIQAMLETGLLNNGTDTHYASGLRIGDYRGLPTVEHGGADAGFRADFLRFPTEHFAVIILSNFANVDADALARKVADVYLSDRLHPVPPSQTEADPSTAPAHLVPVSNPKPFSPSAEQLAEYTGTYYSDELGVLYFVSEHGGQLALRYPRGVLTLEPVEQDAFKTGFPIGRVRFLRDTATRAIRGLTVTNDPVRGVAFVRTDLHP